MVWMLLAFGGALFVGNVLALVRPPAKRPARPNRSDAKRRITEADLQSPVLEKAPKARTIAMATVGFVVSLWAVASLLR